MKDIEKLAKLFDEFDVEYSYEDYTDDGTLNILVEEGNKNVTGYSGFYAFFSFDKEGKFIDISVGE